MRVNSPPPVIAISAAAHGEPVEPRGNPVPVQFKILSILFIHVKTRPHPRPSLIPSKHPPMTFPPCNVGTHPRILCISQVNQPQYKPIGEGSGVARPPSSVLNRKTVSGRPRARTISTSRSVLPTADATTLRGANLVVPATIALHGTRGKTLAYPSGRMLTPTSHPSPNPPPDSQKPATTHRLTQGNAAANTNQSPTTIVLY